MSYYVLLINWTDKGLASAKDSPGRLQATKKRIEELGGKVHQFLFTIGKYDFVAILELPNDDVFMQFLISFGAQGNVTRIALKAWPDSDAARIFSGI